MKQPLLNVDKHNVFASLRTKWKPVAAMVILEDDVAFDYTHADAITLTFTLQCAQYV